MHTLADRTFNCKTTPMSILTNTATGEKLPEAEIHAQLQKIFICPAFSVSDILRRFLTYIVEETIAGNSNTIKEYTIALNVLNKPASFRPQQDAIVRIHAGRLRRALNYYYKETGVNDDIEISVPKGSYVPVFASRKKTILNSGKDLMPSALQRSADTITLVVLPFRTFESNVSKQTFADNLGQQLCAEFGKFPGFSVISYHAIRQLAPEYKKESDLASDFGAHYAITGNVQFEAGRLRVAVQLTDVQKGIQIWTELYHRNYTNSNLFETGDQILASVIGVLGDFNGIIIQQMTRGFTKNQFGIAFYTALSCYQDFYSGFNEEIFNSASVAMERLIEQNPVNETAHALLGDLSLLAFLFEHPYQENPHILGLRYACKALKINPLSQYGHVSLAMAHIFLNNREACLQTLEKALTLNPNASGMTGMIGCLLISAGEYQEGMECIRKSIDRNKSHPAFFRLFISLYHFKQKEFSLAYAAINEMGLTEMGGLNMILRASILFQMGRKAESDLLMKDLKTQTFNKGWISREFFYRFLLDRDLVDQLFKGLNTLKIPFLTVA
jgi:adenylate cyclase